MPVRALRAAIVAGLIAGVYLVFVVAIQGVPDRVVGWIGGPNGGIARHGGLVLRYRPPEGYDAAKFQHSIERRGAAVRRDGSLLVVEVPGVSEPEANRIAALLTQGGLEFREVVALPPVGVIEEQRWIAPAALAALLGLATLGIGLVGGALVGLVIGLAVRAARPIWQPRPRRRDGKPAVRRILVTLLAPAALIVLQNLWLPGVNDVELDHLIGGAGGHPASVVNPASVGLAPILAAFVLVELAMLVTARGRRARHQPGARIAIGRYVAILGAVLAVIQSYFAVGYLDSLQRSGLEILAPGTAIHLAVMASLTAGTMLLVIVASMIRQHGLGNGYGALIVSSWAITVVPRIVDHPTAGHALGVLTLAMIGGATMALLRMRVGGGGEASLRLPASGSVPLATASSVVPQLWFLAQLGVISASGGAARWLDSVQHRTGLFAGGIVVLVPLWSFAFSRPGVVAPLAVRAELAPPGRSTWRRATLLSLVTLLGIGVVAQVSAAIDPDAQPVCEASTAMMVAALVLDLLDDARARRVALVAVWPLQQPQHAELVRRVLWDAGIECHLQSSHLRTLLGFFGPYAPIDVLVAAADAPGARDRIGTLYEELPLKRVFG